MAIDVVPQVVDVGNGLFERRSRRGKVVLEMGFRLHEMPGLAVGGLECRLELAMRVDCREEVTLGCFRPLLCRLELAPEQRCLGVGPGDRGREIRRSRRPASGAPLRLRRWRGALPG